MRKSEYTILILAFITLILFLGIFRWIHYLTQNQYIKKCGSCSSNSGSNKQGKEQGQAKEGFSQVSPKPIRFGMYPYTQWMPQWSRENLYGIFPTNPSTLMEGLIDRGQSDTSHTVNLPINDPTSCKNMCIVGRCSATGQQCLADVDCPGCNPYPGDPFDVKRSTNVPGDNDAGKMTVGATPQYSTLTTDMGTRASIFEKENMMKVPKGSFGPSVWRFSADVGQELYDKRYRPKDGDANFPMNYPEQETVTGMFVNKEPLPSNY